MENDLLRKPKIARLHVYPDGVDTVPNEIMINVSNQIEQMRNVPKKLDEHTQEEIDEFPKLWEPPKDYLVT